MTYLSFDRQILCKTESSEGTAIACDAANFVDTQVDIDVTFEPVMNERDLVRPGFTKLPDLFASSGLASGTMVGTGTITFTVEASLKLEASPVSVAPQWAPLLIACGFEQIDDVKRSGIGAVTGGPFFNREQLEVAAADSGRAFGTHFDGDSFIYYTDTGGIADTNVITGAVSGATATASGAAVDVGIGYALNTTLGNGDASSCTIELYRGGKIIIFKGCRGSVAIEFTSTNRAMMTFTMQGVLESVANGSKETGISIGHALPQTFNDATLSLAEHASATPFTSAFFDTLSLDLGNEIAVRPDANSAAGFKAARIIGRAPTLSLNPDSILGGTTSATVFDFYEKWIEGLSVRCEWKVGAGMNAKSLLFRTTALVIDGVAPSDRDETEVEDVSCKLTGGLYGDSVEPTTPTVRFHDDRGYDNEMTILLF